jgi:hypothetical protein
MRWWELLAPHPWLRTGLVLVVVVVVVAGGVRLWTSVPPDAVHITITQITTDPASRTLHLLKRVTYDRTIQNSTVAERLHRDFAGMPIAGLTFDPFAAYTCGLVGPTFNVYTLTWLREGVPIEQASGNPIACVPWESDGLFIHNAPGWETFNADIEAAAAAN